MSRTKGADEGRAREAGTLGSNAPGRPWATCTFIDYLILGKSQLHVCNRYYTRLVGHCIHVSDLSAIVRSEHATKMKRKWYINGGHGKLVYHSPPTKCPVSIENKNNRLSSWLPSNQFRNAFPSSFVKVRLEPLVRPRHRFLAVLIERDCTVHRVVFTDDRGSGLHLSCSVPFLGGYLELVGLLGAGARPLVAGGVGELVAVGSNEVVEDSGSTGAC
jgi:hypothetical protein